MGKKALLEQFKAKVEASGTSVNHILKMCEFNEVSNDFSSDTIHDYSVGCLNGAWWMFQRQQEKVEELQKEFAEDERFLKEQIKDKDLKISNLEYLQGMDKELIQTLQGRSKALQDKVNDLQKQYDQHDKWLLERNRDCNELYNINAKHVAEKVELQKRVDKAIRLLVEAELYQSEPNIDLAVKALKGEG
ncbi:TPA: hypothetical protein ACJB9M_000883 [Acinetobacter baumannii]